MKTWGGNTNLGGEEEKGQSAQELPQQQQAAGVDYVLTDNFTLRILSESLQLYHYYLQATP